jgi:uncharacterized protein with GYD domain
VAKFIVFFSYSDEATSRMLERPADRAAAVTKLMEAAGGKLETFYWMLGPYDGLAILDLPDSKAAASTALAVLSSGSLRRFETYELIPHEDIPGIEQTAREVSRSYQAPGEDV